MRGNGKDNQLLMRWPLKQQTSSGALDVTSLGTRGGKEGSNV